MQYYNESAFERYFDIRKVLSERVKKTYSEALVCFLNSLSKSILKNKGAKKFPDLMTFGYFIRRSNLIKFKENFLDNKILEYQFGRGCCLHIAPSNIPMNFAFSFVMGFMAGNVNIVRLPSKSFEQVEVFLDIFNEVIQKEKYLEFKKTIFFVRVDRNSKKLIELISQVDCLIVWGGDKTVKEIKKYEKLPSCEEIYFPNKKSSLIVDSNFFLNIEGSDLYDFNSKFYNDTYLVDQNACSSPSMIIWYGSPESNKMAKEKFIYTFLPFLNCKYSLEPTHNIEKILDLLRFCHISEASLTVDKIDPLLWFLEADKSNDLSPKLGTFIVKSISDLSSIKAFFRNNEQTVTYFGLSKEDLDKLHVISNGKVDRIVSVGRALDMGFIWDGRNMVNALSKIVTL